VIHWSSKLGVGREADNLNPQNIDVEKTSEMPQRGMINRRRFPIRKRMILIHGTFEHCSKPEH
jgi:hypothetical protein